MQSSGDASLQATMKKRRRGYMDHVSVTIGFKGAIQTRIMGVGQNFIPSLKVELCLVRSDRNLDGQTHPENDTPTWTNWKPIP